MRQERPPLGRHDERDPRRRRGLPLPSRHGRRALTRRRRRHRVEWARLEPRQHRTMYFIDTLRYGVDAFDFDAESGSVSNRRRLVDIPKHEGLADGLTVDGDGCIWVALCFGGAVRRYTPNGRLDAGPFACPSRWRRAARSGATAIGPSTSPPAEAHSPTRNAAGSRSPAPSSAPSAESKGSRRLRTAADGVPLRVLIRDGTVICPASGLRGRFDVAIVGERIDAVGESLPAEAGDQVVDAKGLIVTPGLIDLHVHVFDGQDLGVPAATVGLVHGVTTPRRRWKRRRTPLPGVPRRLHEEGKRAGHRLSEHLVHRSHEHASRRGVRDPLLRERRGMPSLRRLQPGLDRRHQGPCSRGDGWIERHSTSGARCRGGRRRRAAADGPHRQRAAASRVDPYCSSAGRHRHSLLHGAGESPQPTPMGGFGTTSGRRVRAGSSSISVTAAVASTSRRLAY